MQPVDQEVFEQIRAFATSLGLGLLMGIERERRGDTRAGLRTFALVGVLGCMMAQLATELHSAWVMAAGLLGLAIMDIASMLKHPPTGREPGTTTGVALLLCFGLGAMVWLGHSEVAIMIAIAATALLYFKRELHGLSSHLTPTDWHSVLQFAALSLVVLPILPDHDYGPYGALNPHQIWWMVVLISGMSLAGYAALRWVGVSHGAVLVGLFGGMVSSTATTMVFARHARRDQNLRRMAALVIVLANLVLFVRLGLLCALVSPGLLNAVAPVFVGGLLAGVIPLAWLWRSTRRMQRSGSAVLPGQTEALPMPQVKNPTEIGVALSFGLLFAGILLLSAWLQDIAGNRGLYLVALASGLTDVDAITLSTLRLFDEGKLQIWPAVAAITLAVVANLAVKIGLVLGIGGAPLARSALPGMLAIGLGMALGLVLGGVGG